MLFFILLCLKIQHADDVIWELNFYIIPVGCVYAGEFTLLYFPLHMCACACVLTSNQNLGAKI